MRSTTLFIVFAISGLYLLTLGFALLLHEKKVLAAAAMAMPLIWLSVVDLREHIIPDMATASIGLIGIACQIFLYDVVPWPVILVALVVLCAFWLVGEVYFRKNGHEGLGIGDAKLLAAGTLCVGINQFWVMLFLASAGGIMAILLSQREKRSIDKYAIPFGPFIAYSIFLTFIFLRG